MNDYSEFPPINLFKRVLRSSPQSALIYAYLWKHKAKKERLSFKRKDIKSIFLISPTLFRNYLLSIGRLDLISFEETYDFFQIDFYDNDES